jgi:hypothetical protein
VRTRVRALPNVEIVGECEVVDLVASDARDRVAGVRVLHSAANSGPGSGARSEETLQADLVVDATGRTGRAAAWLPAWSSHRPGCCAPRPWCVWQRETCVGVVHRRPAPRHQRSASQPAPAAHLLSESAQTSQGRPVPGLARAPEVTVTAAASPNRTPPGIPGFWLAPEGSSCPHPFAGDGLVRGWGVNSAIGVRAVAGPRPGPVADWSVGQWLQLGSSCGLNCAGAGAPG